MSDLYEKQHINVSRLRDSFADDSEFIVEMYGLFVEDAGERLDALDRAIADHDASSLRHVAHAIKGSSANVGAEQMSDLARELEIAEVEHDHESVVALAQALRTEFEAVEAFVHDYARSPH